MMVCIIITVLSGVHAAELDVVHLERVGLALRMVVLEAGLCQNEFLKFDAQLWVNLRMERN